MNLLARAKSASHLFSSSGKPLFYCRRHVTALQQCNFYATRTTLTKPRTQKASHPPPPPPSFSLGINPADAPTSTWPKPREMPYQPKVANFVNLIGNVTIPVQFESDSDGKHFATTVISVGAGDRNSPLVIPIVCEGDLAHVVACHVKQDNCVFVAGKLSADPLRLVPIEKLGKFHIVVENLFFVEGYKKVASDKKVEVSEVETNKLDKISSIETSSEPLPESATLEPENVGFSNQKWGSKGGESVTKKKDLKKSWELWRDLLNNPLEWFDYRKHKAHGMVNAKYPDFKQKGTEEPLWVGSAPDWVLAGIGKLECDTQDFKPKSRQVQEGVRPSAKPEDSWKNLLENPQQWFDYRKHKTDGLVKGGFPDFKHKETKESLWITGAPEWVFAKLGKLDCDVQDIRVQPKQVQGGISPSAENKNAKLEDSWKNLVENPKKWWDNRVGKINPKQPDFKHKETGEALWLNTSPEWALSKLPPVKAEA